MAPRRAGVLAVLACVIALLAACSPSGGLLAASAPRTVVHFPAPPEVVVTPADHAAAVPLNAPVTVSASSGKLSSVSVTRAGGAAVPGQLSADGATWTATDGLDPAATYVVTATAVGASQTHTTTSASFSTIRHISGRLLSSTSPLDGSTVGIGEPFDIRFSTDIPQPQQAAIVEHLHVTSTPAQTGAWHWFSGDDLHYRPAQFWQPGTKVTVTADFHGVDAGNGVWGLAGWTSSFTVGDKHVSLINNQTHQMQVYVNDQLQYTWPVSLGKTGFETLEGTLVVLYKTPKVKMTSCTTFGGAACIPGSVNYYNDYVYEDTAISTSGFYIHAAPWSVAQQGYVNVSHGCVNLSTDRATTFFNLSVPGDVVQISGTGNPANLAEGEADWQIPFAQWDNTGVPPSPAPSASPSPSSAPAG